MKSSFISFLSIAIIDTCRIVLSLFVGIFFIMNWGVMTGSNEGLTVEYNLFGHEFFTEEGDTFYHLMFF